MLVRVERQAAPVFVLSFHSDYACRSTAACCRAPWDITIDGARAGIVDAAIARGAFVVPGGSPWRARHPKGSSLGDQVLLARTDEGACAFLDRGDPRLCSMERACGHETLPEACQQFPRVTLADDRGLSVTLSHYCPTVAGLALSEPREPVTVVTAPRRFARAALVAGLDARGHWPPLLRPGVLCSPQAWSSWERWVVDLLGNAGADPFAALDHVSAAAERLRRWSLRDGDLDGFVDRVLADWGPPARTDPPARVGLDPTAEWRVAWSAVPGGRATAPDCGELTDSGAALLAQAADALAAHGRAVGRYLAARAFASWCAYQGAGLLSHVASLRTSLGVLLVELAHEMGRPDLTSVGGVAQRFSAVLQPDRTGLKTCATSTQVNSGPDPRGHAGDSGAALSRAMQRADWLLVHLADGGPLAARWSATE